MTNHKDIERSLDLNAVGILWLLRMHRGDEISMHGDFSSAIARECIVRRGLAELRQTPKGKRKWYVLSDAGKALIPDCIEWQKAFAAAIKKQASVRGAEERVRHYAPDLVKALRQQLAVVSERKPKTFPSLKAWALSALRNPATGQIAAEAEATLAMLNVLEKIDTEESD